MNDNYVTDTIYLSIVEKKSVQVAPLSIDR